MAFCGLLAGQAACNLGGCLQAGRRNVLAAVCALAVGAGIHAFECRRDGVELCRLVLFYGKFEGAFAGYLGAGILRVAEMLGRSLDPAHVAAALLRNLGEDAGFVIQQLLA